MAKANMITICGTLLDYPKITSNKSKLTARVFTTRGNRSDGKGDIQARWDDQIIMSKDADIIECMEDFEKNDLVLIKGVLATRVVPRKT